MSADRKAGVPRTNPVDLIVADIWGNVEGKKSRCSRRRATSYAQQRMELTVEGNIHQMDPMISGNKLMVTKSWNVLEPGPMRCCDVQPESSRT